MSDTDDMVLVPKEFIDFVRRAPVSSGVCMCGRSEVGHDREDHGYVDVWDYTLSEWLKQLGVGVAP